MLGGKEGKCDAQTMKRFMEIAAAFAMTGGLRLQTALRMPQAYRTQGAVAVLAAGAAALKALALQLCQQRIRWQREVFQERIQRQS